MYVCISKNVYIFPCGYICILNVFIVFIVLFIILIIAQPLHWVYSHDKMKEILSGGLDPAFSPVSHNPFYTIETGNQSPYGDQLVVQLKCLVKYKGTYVAILCIDCTHAYLAGIMFSKFVF